MEDGDDVKEIKGHFAKIKTKDEEEKEVVLGVLENISDKIAEEARLNLLATIFDNSKESILITDEQTPSCRHTCLLGFRHSPHQYSFPCHDQQV